MPKWKNTNMKVYLVIRTITEHYSNELCWDDGWYDDYYEEVVTSEQIIGVYATPELAEKIAEREDNKCSGEDHVDWLEYDVIGEEDEEILCSE